MKRLIERLGRWFSLCCPFYQTGHASLSRPAPTSVSPSPALLAAQKRLLSAQQRVLAERKAVGEQRRADCIEDGRLPVESQPSSAISDQSAVVAQLPQHLGWGSERLSNTLRSAAALRAKTQQTDETPANWWQSLSYQTEISSEFPKTTHQNKTIRVHSSIALAMLREEQAAAGRIWFLLRHLDEAGRGWLTIEEARTMLTQKEAALCVCGWRQLRNLLKKGEGVYWVRENGRIWLKSTPKVAQSLNVTRLQGKPVELPLGVLTQKIGTVRAHLYATFHSGRNGAPIARETISRLSGTSQCSQRNYEKVARIKAQSNFAIGQQTLTENKEQAAWQRGNAFFELRDHRGQQGEAGKKYLAWQLPNSYAGPYAQQSPSSRKRINQKLTDLQLLGTAGNGECVVEKRFFDNGQLAGKAYNREERELYWKGQSGRNNIWYCLEVGAVG